MEHEHAPPQGRSAIQRAANASPQVQQLKSLQSAANRGAVQRRRNPLGGPVQLTRADARETINNYMETHPNDPGGSLGPNQHENDHIKEWIYKSNAPLEDIKVVIAAFNQHNSESRLSMDFLNREVKIWRGGKYWGHWSQRFFQSTNAAAPNLNASSHSVIEIDSDSEDEMDHSQQQTNVRTQGPNSQQPPTTASAFNSGIQSGGGFQSQAMASSGPQFPLSYSQQPRNSMVSPSGGQQQNSDSQVNDLNMGQQVSATNNSGQTGYFVDQNPMLPGFQMFQVGNAFVVSPDSIPTSIPHGPHSGNLNNSNNSNTNNNSNVPSIGNLLPMGQLPSAATNLSSSQNLDSAPPSSFNPFSINYDFQTGNLNNSNNSNTNSNNSNSNINSMPGIEFEPKINLGNNTQSQPHLGSLTMHPNNGNQMGITFPGLPKMPNVPVNKNPNPISDHSNGSNLNNNFNFGVAGGLGSNANNNAPFRKQKPARRKKDFSNKHSRHLNDQDQDVLYDAPLNDATSMVINNAYQGISPENANNLFFSLIETYTRGNVQIGKKVAKKNLIKPDTLESIPVIDSHAGAAKVIRSWNKVKEVHAQKKSSKFPRGPLFALNRGDYYGVVEVNPYGNDIVFRTLKKHDVQGGSGGDNGSAFARHGGRIFSWTDQAKKLNQAPGSTQAKLKDLLNVIKHHQTPNSEAAMEALGAMICDSRHSIRGYIHSLSVFEEAAKAAGDTNMLKFFNSDVKNNPNWTPSAKGNKTKFSGRKGVLGHKKNYESQDNLAASVIDEDSVLDSNDNLTVASLGNASHLGGWDSYEALTNDGGNGRAFGQEDLALKYPNDVEADWGSYILLRDNHDLFSPFGIPREDFLNYLNPNNGHNSNSSFSSHNNDNFSNSNHNNNNSNNSNSSNNNSNRNVGNNKSTPLKFNLDLSKFNHNFSNSNPNDRRSFSALSVNSGRKFDELENDIGDTYSPAQKALDNYSQRHQRTDSGNHIGANQNYLDYFKLHPQVGGSSSNMDQFRYHGSTNHENSSFGNDISTELNLEHPGGINSQPIFQPTEEQRPIGSVINMDSGNDNIGFGGMGNNSTPASSMHGMIRPPMNTHNPFGQHSQQWGNNTNVNNFNDDTQTIFTTMADADGFGTGMTPVDLTNENEEIDMGQNNNGM